MEFLKQKKNVVLTVSGLLAVGGIVAYLYNNYNNENHEEQEVKQVQPVFDIDGQINKLKASINMSNPSLQDVKKILVFSLDVSKKEIFKFSKNFKIDRRKYNKQKRNQNLDQYLRMVAQGMTQIQQIGMSLQQSIMMKIGVTEQTFVKYQHQLGPFMQEQMMSQGVGSNSNKQLTLEQVKRAINLQIQYMANKGDEMVEKLINTCSGWGPQEKSLVPTLISVYIADQVFEDHPEIDQDDLQGAQMKFQHHLQNEMMRLQQVMAPMMSRLTQGLGFGGYPDMMGGMGAGMGGMDMASMPTMEQLEQLRVQDPAAFEQLMFMMTGQMQ